MGSTNLFLGLSVVLGFALTACTTTEEEEGIEAEAEGEGGGTEDSDSESGSESKGGDDSESKGDEDSEDVPESIFFFGAEYEGDAFFWCLDKSCSMNGHRPY